MRDSCAMRRAFIILNLISDEKNHSLGFEKVTECENRKCENWLGLEIQRPRNYFSVGIKEVKC